MKQTNDWWMHAVLYELYVDKFAGNFHGLMKHLDYLNFLGVDCVHLLPFMPSPMIDDGYDISDYQNIREDLGTLKDFEEFAVKAHALGIRIMIDLVLNHASTSHPWFLEAKSSCDNPKRDYFLWSETGKEFAGAANPFAEFTPSNWIWNDATKDYYFSTFYPEQADVNWDNPHVFKEMTDIMDFWTNLGVGGFRLDAASHLIKREGTDCRGLPETHGVLKKLRAYLDASHPGTALLAEVHSSLEATKTYFGTGDECEMVYHFPLAERIFLALKRNDPSLVSSMVEASQNIPERCAWAVFLRNHDEISLTTLNDAEHEELISFLDPMGTYAFNGGKDVASRVATIMYGDNKKILDALRYLFRTPWSLVMYYGDEVGMENEPLKEGEHDARRAVRGSFDWDKACKDQLDPDSILSHVVRMIQEKKK